jgi:hypothetical protein
VDHARLTFREIRSIAATSSPVQTVALLNLQLISWPEVGDEQDLPLQKST